MTIAKRSAKILALAAAMFSVSTTANAADLSYGEPVQAPAVHGSITAYGWYVFPGGDITIGETSIGIGDGNGDTSLFDILDGFFMANGEIRYGEFGLYGDILYAALSNETSGQVSRGWEFDGTIFTGALSYEVARSDAGWLQVLAGARYWSVDTGVNLGGLSGQASDDWVDAVGGLRGRYDLSPSIFVEGTGLVGGGGSDFMWDVYGGLGYQFTENFSGSLGYRGMGVDYTSGRTTLDITFQGPVAGLTLRF